MLVRRVFEKGLERAMNDQISISTNGTGEVAVVAFGKAIVADRFGGIGGAFETFEQSEFDDVFGG